MQPSANPHRPLAPSSCARLSLSESTQSPSAARSHAARSNASRSRRETNALPSPYSSHRSRTQASNAATVTPISEQPLSAARFLYATARSVSGSSTTSYAIEVSMPDILAHPLSAFGPIHGTYPKFRRSSRPQRKEGRPPFRTTGLPKTDLSHDRKPQHAPDIPQQSSYRRKRGAALDGRTTRRRTWPSGAPGDRNARWRPSRCARTARRRAPGTRGSGGCSGPRS